MKTINSILCALIFFSIVNSTANGQEVQALGVPERRLALLIGNAKYLNSGELANPVNDARAMRDALQQVGFDVFEYENLNQAQLKQAIDNFGVKLKNYNVGLFFYAGHGIQSKGANYLIPVDAVIQSEQQIEYDCVQADRVLGFMEAAGSKVNIVILDACRNNPFERSWSRAVDGSGLAFMSAPTGSLIAYSTSPGRTASDGSGSNGLYTSALLENLKSPNLNILQMFQNVRRTVSEKSNKHQIPWESTSLTADFFFINKEVVSEKVDIKATWKLSSGPDGGYWFYINDQEVGSRVTSSWYADNLMVYDPVTNLTCLLENYKNQPKDKILNARLVNTTINSFWSGSDNHYLVYVKGETISDRVKSVFVKEDLIVYDPKTNSTYILSDFNKNSNGSLRPALIIDNSDFTFWKKEKGSYWLISKGQDVRGKSKLCYLDNDAIVYFDSTNVTYILKDYLIESFENKFRPAQVLSYQDNVFWLKKQEGYFLINKGEYMQQRTTSYWKGSDLYVTDTVANNRFILLDYQNVPSNQLKVAMIDR